MKWIAIIAVTGMAFTCRAEWADIPLESVVTNSDLIVVATLTDVKRNVSNTLVRCQGTLQIEEVLKGGLVKTATLEWCFSIPPKSVSTDHTGLVGKKLLWLLKRSDSNTYEAHYFKRVQAVDKKDDIKKLIEKTPNKLPENIGTNAPNSQQ